MNGTRSGDDGLFAVAADPAGGVFAGGVLYTPEGGRDAAVVKVAGDVEVWRRVIAAGSPGDDAVRAIALDAQGDAIVAGTLERAQSGDDWLVAKLAAATGAELWRVTLDGDGSQDSPFAVALDPNGDVVAAGYFQDAAGRYRVGAVKLAGASGAEIWRFVLPVSGGADFAEALAVDAEGDAYLAGGYDGAFWVARLEGATGMLAWERKFTQGRARAVALHPVAGTVDAAGGFATAPAGGDFGVVRLDRATGMPIWAYATDGTDTISSDVAYAIAPAGDGSADVFAAGVVDNMGTGSDLFAVRLDGATGGDRWFRTVDAGVAYVADLAMTAAGSPIVVGYDAQLGTDIGVQATAVAFDPESGATRWTGVIDGGVEGYDVASAIAVAPGDRPHVVGSVAKGLAGTQAFVARLAGADGAVAARLDLDGGGFDSGDAGAAVAHDAAGDVIAGGQLENASPRYDRQRDFTVVKLDRRRGDERWRYAFPGSAANTRVEAVAAAAGGAVVVAGAAPGAPGDDDATVVRLTPDGMVEWVRQFPGGSPPPGDPDEALDAVVGPDGGVYVTGVLRRPTTGNDLFAVKLSAAGGELWRRIDQSDGNNVDRGEAIAVDGAGDAAVGGQRDRQWLVLKLAGADGAVRWPALIEGRVAGGYGQLADVAVDPATGDVLAVGSLENTAGQRDLAVVRLAAATGQELWRATWNGAANGEDRAVAVAIAGDGDVIVAGVLANVPGRGDLFVVRLAPDKTPRWSVTVPDATPSRRGVAVDPSGDVLIAGIIVETVAGTGADVIALRLAGATGAELWRRRAGGSAVDAGDRAAGLALDGGGNVTVVGDLVGAGTNRDLTVIRLTAAGDDASCVATDAADPGCGPCPGSGCPGGDPCGGACDDGDPCTADACDPARGCASTPLAGPAAVTCGFDRPLAVAPCAGQRVPRAIPKTVTRAGAVARRGLVAAAESRRAKLLGRASKLLGRTVRLVDRASRRRRRPLSAECAAAFRGLVSDAKARVDAARP